MLCSYKEFLLQDGNKTSRSRELIYLWQAITSTAAKASRWKFYELASVFLYECPARSFFYSGDIAWLRHFFFCCFCIFSLFFFVVLCFFFRSFFPYSSSPVRPHHGLKGAAQCFACRGLTRILQLYGLHYPGTVALLKFTCVVFSFIPYCLHASDY